MNVRPTIRSGSQYRVSSQAKAADSAATPSAIATIAAVFELDFDELSADEGAGLWPQRIHASLASG